MAQSKDLQKNIIIFDIDSASIGAALVACSYNSKGVLTRVRALVESRKNLPTKGELVFDDFFKQTVKTFQELADEIQLQSPAELEGIFCNISAPWMSSQKRIVKYNQSTGFKVTEALVQKCIKQELDASLSRNLDFAEHKGLSVVERRTIDLYLNGFPTLKPFGQSAQSMDIHSLTSVMSDATKDAFVHVIERSFHREPIFFSNTFVNYHTLKEVLPDENNAIVLDVSGELSEVFVIEDDHLRHIASFPVGTSSLIRVLSESLGVSFKETISLLKLYYQGRLDQGYIDTIEANISAAFCVWLREFYTTTDELSQQGLLPSVICLSVEHHFASWFEAELLASHELAEHLHSRKKPALINLYQAFASFTKESQNIDSFADSQLALLAHFVTRIY